MVLYNRFIIPLRKIVCLSSLCFCDDSVDCDISPAYQIFWNPVLMILSKQNLSNNNTSFCSHWCFLTIFTSNETVCFGQCLDKKLDHLNFIPLRKKFSLNSSAKMNLGGGAQKNQSREQCVTVTDLQWVATTRALVRCLPVEPRIPLGSEGSKTDQEAQATRSNANIMDWPQLKSCKTQWFLRNPRAPLKITSERLLASIISSLTQ